MSPEQLSGTKSGGSDQLVDLPEPRPSKLGESVILVAEDDAIIRRLVTRLLQEEGYSVLSAADGHAGLELSRQHPGSIDLVITDMQMPRLNGSDLCAHLLEERPGIKAIVMSGSDPKKIVPQIADLPFLPKPFDGQTLKSKVRAILADSI